MLFVLYYIMTKKIEILNKTHKIIKANSLLLCLVIILDLTYLWHFPSYWRCKHLETVRKYLASFTFVMS